MRQHLHNLLRGFFAFALFFLFCAPVLAEDGDLSDHMAQWERLDHQRAALISELESLESDHQNFVETIENLKDQHARGEISRRKLETKLRENLHTVRALENLQGQLRDVDRQQASLRREILDQFQARQRQLEQRLRESSADERADLITELNQLQQARDQFSVPLPETDQQRVDQALADARQISDDHPRAMLSAADELEDTRDQLERRLTGIHQRIEQLERARALHRQSQQFGAFDRFFDEGERGRTLARYEQAVETGDGSRTNESQNASDSPDSEGDDHETTPEAAPESAEDKMNADFGGNSAEGTSGFTGDETTSDPDTIESSDPEPELEPETEPETETIVIESEPSDQDTSYLSDQGMERDLLRLEQERDELEEQAEQLRRKAEELRRKAQESY